MKKMILLLIILVLILSLVGCKGKDETAPVFSGVKKSFDFIVGEVNLSDILNDVSAYDDIDGDLTEDIKISGNYSLDVEGIYTVILSVEDASGNKTTVNVTININNGNPTIHGLTNVNLLLGEEFNPLEEITANDKYNKDLTSIVEVTVPKGWVKKEEGIYTCDILGKHKFNYKVVDSQGNTTIETREVEVDLSKESLNHNLVIFASVGDAYEVWGGQIIPIFPEHQDELKGFELINKYDNGGIAYIDDEYPYYVILTKPNNYVEIDAIKIKDSYLDGDDTIYLNNCGGINFMWGKYDNNKGIVGLVDPQPYESNRFTGSIVFKNKQYGHYNNDYNQDDIKSGKYLVYVSSDKLNEGNGNRDQVGYHPEENAELGGFKLIGEYTGTQEIQIPIDTKKVLIHSPEGESLLIDSIETYDDEDNFIGYTSNYDGIFGVYSRDNAAFKESGNLNVPVNAAGSNDGIPAYFMDTRSYGVFTTYIKESDIVITPRVSKIKINVINEANRELIFSKYGPFISVIGLSIKTHHNENSSIDKKEFYKYGKLHYVIDYEYDESNNLERKLVYDMTKDGLLKYAFIIDNNTIDTIQIGYYDITNDKVTMYASGGLEFAENISIKNGGTYLYKYKLSNGTVKTLPIKVNINVINVIVEGTNIYPGNTVYKGTKIKFQLSIKEDENLGYELYYVNPGVLNGNRKLINDNKGNGFAIPKTTGKHKFAYCLVKDGKEKWIEFEVNVIEPDIDGNGIVDNNDIEYYQRFMNKEVDGVEVDFMLDFNGDKIIDELDVEILSRQIH